MLLNQKYSVHVKEDELKAKVIEYFGFDIFESKRHHNYSRARYCLMYALYMETELSYREIAEFCGLKNHATAYYGIEKMTYSVKKEKDVYCIRRINMLRFFINPEGAKEQALYEKFVQHREEFEIYLARLNN